MAKKSLKLSILVPVYNNLEFLPLCIESIKNQSFRNFECLLINDGSTDGSLEFLKNVAKSDKRFRVINKENSGYGASLNLGIKESKGEYIGIVESDDFIHRDFYKELLSHDDDIIKCSFTSFHGKTWRTKEERIFHEIKAVLKDGIKTTAKITKKGTALVPTKNQKIFLTDPTVWSAVYKKDMLEKNEVKFLETEGASYQDAGFQFKAFASAKTIFCFEKPLYYYRRDNEKSSVKSKKKAMAIKAEFDSVDEFISDKKELTTIANACRFRSYNWNLNRLSLKEALRFAKIAKSDYKKSGFNPRFFKTDKQPRAHELKFSTKHPTFYVLFRPVFSLKNKVISIAAKTLHKA